MLVEGAHVCVCLSQEKEMGDGVVDSRQWRGWSYANLLTADVKWMCLKYKMNSFSNKLKLIVA